MSFWIVVAALLALALVILLLPLLRAAHHQAGDQRQQQNIQIAREKKQSITSNADISANNRWIWTNLFSLAPQRTEEQDM